MSAAAPERLSVGRLRVVDRAGDGVRARLAAERLLSAAHPVSPGLAAGEILVVRKLADPLPGGGLARWRAAVEARLEVLRVDAARPALGPVAADAPGVLFSDLGELLACLTLDAATGVAGQRWWWRAWLGPVAPSVAVARAWREHPSQVPAIVELLAARGVAAPTIARTLTAQEAGAVAGAVARTFGLAEEAGIGRPAPEPSPDAAPARAPAPGASTRAARTALPGAGARHASRAGAPEDAAPRAPASGSGDRAPELETLARLVPELFDDAAPAEEHRRLLGLALGLARRPDVVRAPGFGRVLEQAAGPGMRSESAGPGRVAVRGASPATRPAAAPPGAEPATEPHGRPQRVARPGGPADGPLALRATDGPPAGSATRATAATRATGATGATGVVTDLGGLFLLPGLALYLGLYGDFTTPNGGGDLALDPWDFAVLLGQSLLPRAPRSDPAWSLLAGLAGRPEGEQPGGAFRAPRSWRVPAAWVAPFGPGGRRWRWDDGGGRLRVRHPAGFLVLDVGLRGRPAGPVLARELRGLRAAPPEQDPRIPIPGGRPLDRWIGAWLAPYVAARLRLAVGARRPAAAAGLTIRQRARVSVTSGRVDVFFALDDLPVAIRRCGLDRTPGWIPAAGRYLALHYV